MIFNDFEQALSPERLKRYLDACNNDTRKAMTLYRYNLRLSQEMFTILSCFEVTLRNAIDQRLRLSLGNDWLMDSFQVGGIFDTPRLARTANIVRGGYRRLQEMGKPYSHVGLLSEMEFGSTCSRESSLQLQDVVCSASFHTSQPQPLPYNTTIRTCSTNLTR